jgi:acyl dehydratase
MRVFRSLDELKAAAGTELGFSEWLEIDQRRIDLFADATGDFQWIHVDPERAKSGPFGRTIAHGYLTLSLWPVLFRRIVSIQGIAMAMNYGAERIRFPAPVPVDSRLRLGITVLSVADVPGGVQSTYRFVFEAEGAPKPCCVADIVIRYVAAP